jgi:serine/threonine-protein kinase
MLGRLRTSVERGVDAGEIRGDVGVDLRNLIASAREVDPDDSARVRERTGALKAKVETRVREGGIARRRGDDLLRILSSG